MIKERLLLRDLMKKDNFLILDSSSSVLKIGLRINNEKISLDYTDDFKHLENIIPLMDSLLSKIENSNIKDIQNILVCNGPGSFTGIRIGLATAYGLYSSLENVICYGFNIFDVYNYLINQDNAVIIPIIDAKKNKFYCSFIEKNKEYQYLDLELNEIVTIIAKLKEDNKNIVFTGKDFGLIRGQIHIAYEYLYPDDFKADDLISFGEYFLNNNEIKKNFPEPLYIRKSEAEISLLHKKGIL